MSIVLAVTGFAGVGKSTAVDFLEKAYGMTQVYLGGFVIEEVRRRGLPATRLSEAEVRLELRSVDRSAVMRLGVPSITSALDVGVSVVIDAVLLVEELSLLRTVIGSDRLHLVSIESRLESRCERLAARAKRPFSHDEVIARDLTESGDLRTDLVFAAAQHRLRNDGTLEDFRLSLERLASAVGLPVRAGHPSGSS